MSVEVHSLTLSHTPESMKCDSLGFTLGSHLRKPLLWLRAQGHGRNNRFFIVELNLVGIGINVSCTIVVTHFFHQEFDHSLKGFCPLSPTSY